MRVTRKFKHMLLTAIFKAFVEDVEQFKIYYLIKKLFFLLLINKLETDKEDRRFNFHRNRSEISAYAEEYYKMFPKKDATFAKAASQGNPAASLKKET